MGRIFLLAFLTISALLLFFTLHARAGGSAADSVPGPVRVKSRARALLQNPEPEKSIADPPSTPSSGEESDDEEREAAAEAPGEESQMREMERHHSPDKSVAGGGVIIGGLVTAIFAAVYCYIRVTRRRPGENLA